MILKNNFRRKQNTENKISEKKHTNWIGHGFSLVIQMRQNS